MDTQPTTQSEEEKAKADAINLQMAEKVFTLARNTLSPFDRSVYDALLRGARTMADAEVVSALSMSIHGTSTDIHRVRRAIRTIAGRRLGTFTEHGGAGLWAKAFASFAEVPMRYEERSLL